MTIRTLLPQTMIIPAISAEGQVINGTDGNDPLQGTAASDTISGGAGNDTIDGGAGKDWIAGGVGDDTYLWGAGSGNDMLGEDGGVDTLVIGAKSTDVVLLRDPHAPVTNLLVRLGGETLTLVNYFSVNGLIEKLTFSDGVTLDFHSVIQVLQRKNAPWGGEIIQGNDDSETLSGHGRGDVIYGGGGDDTLVGGLGKDRLVGGLGSDLFTFTSSAETRVGGKRDLIADFTSGEDRIDLGGIDANTQTAADDAFTTLLTGRQKFTEAGQLRYDARKGILYGNTDKDAAAEFEIQLKGKALLLKLTDFVL